MAVHRTSSTVIVKSEKLIQNILRKTYLIRRKKIPQVYPTKTSLIVQTKVKFDIFVDDQIYATYKLSCRKNPKTILITLLFLNRKLPISQKIDFFRKKIGFLLIVEFFFFRVQNRIIILDKGAPYNLVICLKIIVFDNDFMKKKTFKLNDSQRI